MYQVTSTSSTLVSWIKNVLKFERKTDLSETGLHLDIIENRICKAFNNFIIEGYISFIEEEKECIEREEKT